MSFIDRFYNLNKNYNTPEIQASLAQIEQAMPAIEQLSRLLDVAGVDISVRTSKESSYKGSIAEQRAHENHPWLYSRKPLAKIISQQVAHFKRTTNTETYFRGEAIVVERSRGYLFAERKDLDLPFDEDEMRALVLDFAHANKNEAQTKAFEQAMTMFKSAEITGVFQAFRDLESEALKIKSGELDASHARSIAKSGEQDANAKAMMERLGLVQKSGGRTNT